MRHLEPDRVIVSIGRRVAELRRERKWTQANLAERINATFQYIARVEGGTNLTVYTLVKFANVFKVPLSALFETPADAPPRRPGRPRKSP